MAARVCVCVCVCVYTITNKTSLAIASSMHLCNLQCPKPEGGRAYLRVQWKLNWENYAQFYCSSPDVIVSQPGVATLFRMTTTRGGDNEETTELVEHAVTIFEKETGNIRIEGNRLVMFEGGLSVELGELHLVKTNSWIAFKCSNRQFLERILATKSIAFEWVCMEHSEETLFVKNGYHFSVCSGGQPLSTIFRLKACGLYLVAKALVSYTRRSDGPTIELIECGWKGQGLGSLLLSAMEDFYRERFPITTNKLYIHCVLNQTVKRWYERQGYQEFFNDEGEQDMWKDLSKCSSFTKKSTPSIYQ